VLYSPSGDKRDIHTRRRNYDDINEFFWSASCLRHSYCHKAYLWPLLGGDSHSTTTSDDLDSNDDDTDEKTPTTAGIRREYRGFVRAQLRMPELASGLRQAGKTYAETRSWAHVAKTFAPILQFYAVRAPRAVVWFCVFNFSAWTVYGFDQVTFHVLVALALVLHQQEGTGGWLGSVGTAFSQRNNLVMVQMLNLPMPNSPMFNSPI
jgi:hypothetical protein